MEELVTMVDPNFWSGKRVLLTGHTGFKGSWLALWLRRLGAHVHGLSLDANTLSLHKLLNDGMPDDGILDIRDSTAVLRRVTETKPHIVLHLAAQALVRAGYRDPVGTFETNVTGTVNLLNALRMSADVRSIVVVTTDKVYRNAEDGRAFTENDPLGGHDPYSASKAAAEIVTSSYRQSYFSGRRIGLATARAGNVIGGGDWAEDRLIPDAVRAWSAGEPLQIRRPGAVRPWQHVLEPLAGYMALAERLWSEPNLAEGYNFGPDHAAAAKVGEVVSLASKAYGKGQTLLGDGGEGPHEAGYLMLDSTLAARDLGYRPRWALGETVQRTMDWYSRLQSGAAARQLCLADIEAFAEEPAADVRVAS